MVINYQKTKKKKNNKKNKNKKKSKNKKKKKKEEKQTNKQNKGYFDSSQSRKVHLVRIEFSSKTSLLTKIRRPWVNVSFFFFSSDKKRTSNLYDFYCWIIVIPICDFKYCRFVVQTNNHFFFFFCQVYNCVIPKQTIGINLVWRP